MAEKNVASARGRTSMYAASVRLTGDDDNDGRDGTRLRRMVTTELVSKASLLYDAGDHWLGTVV